MQEPLAAQETTAINEYDSTSKWRAASPFSAQLQYMISSISQNLSPLGLGRTMFAFISTEIFALWFWGLKSLNTLSAIELNTAALNIITSCCTLSVFMTVTATLNSKLGVCDSQVMFLWASHEFATNEPTVESTSIPVWLQNNSFYKQREHRYISP